MKPFDPRKFARDERGNVALMVGLALPMLVLAIGGGAEYAYLLSRKTELQNAVDSAALATHLHYQKNTDLTDAALKTYFDYHLKAALPAKLENSLTFAEETVTVDRNTDILQAKVKANISTKFLRLVHINSVNLSAFAEVKSSPRYTEVALVLDTTKSMEGDKLNELKAAAKSFLNTIYGKLSGKPESFKVAIVPFARYVNVGMEYRNASWISVPEDRTFTVEKSETRCEEWECVEYGMDWVEECYWTGSEDAGNLEEVCENVYKEVCLKEEVTSLDPCETDTWTETKKIKWLGCVGSRSYPNNIEDDDYDSEPVPGVMNHPRRTTKPESVKKGWRWGRRNECPTPLTPLTPLKTNKDTLIAKIDALQAKGFTYIPSGLVWGWRVLSPQEPFSEGASWDDVKNKNVRKIIVLMTDGKNTRAPMEKAKWSYADHHSKDSAKADTLLKELCNNIKATNPATGKPYADIITVTFDVKDTNIKDLMKECSTLGSHEAGSGELVNVFNKIAKKLGELHLSK